MKRSSTSGAPSAPGPVGTALDEMTVSFERFCLAAGLEALGALMEADAATLCGPRHGRGSRRQAQRWGQTMGPIGFHGGKVAVPRPRLRQGGPGGTPPGWGRGGGGGRVGPLGVEPVLGGGAERPLWRAGGPAGGGG